mgnify:CR=1 FL=1
MRTGTEPPATSCVATTAALAACLIDLDEETLDDLLAKIDRVTREEVADVAAEFFSPEGQFLFRLGPLG